MIVGTGPSGLVLALALTEFAWQPSMAEAGLARDALYPDRPDGHVALASSEHSAEHLKACLDTWLRRQRRAL